MFALKINADSKLFAAFCIPAGIGLCLASFFFVLYNDLRWAGYPYEDWDEVAGYNTAQVLRGEHTERAHFYGTIDLGKFVLADIFYTKFDLRGLAASPTHFSNNVPDSLHDRRVFYGPNYWRPQALGAIEYVYFRGIQDHMPIFYARAISLFLSIALFVTFSVFASLHLGWTAFPPILFVAYFFTPPINAEQFSEALPNGFNGLAIAMILVLLFDYARRPSRVTRLAASVLFAFAVNSKFDAAVFALPFFITVTLAHVAAGSPARSVLGVYVECLFAFLAILWVTNPYLWFDPASQITLKAKLLSAVGIGSPPIGQNTLVLNAFIDLVFFGHHFTAAPAQSGMFYFPIGAAAAAASLIAVTFVVIPRVRTPLSRATVPIAFLGFLATSVCIPIFLSNTVYGRYFLPALAILLVGIAEACTRLFSTRHRLLCSLAVTVCLIFATLLLRNMLQLRLLSLETRQGLAANHGLSPNHNRNLAAIHILSNVGSAGANARVLVDQHSYTDLRFFWDNGIDVSYINMYNYREAAAQAKAAGRPTFLLYAIGETRSTPDWVGKWTPDSEEHYRGYLRFLEELEPEIVFPGRQMPLFDWAPVNPNDEIRVAKMGVATVVEKTSP